MAISSGSKILASDVSAKIDTAGTGLTKDGTTLSLATVVTAGNAGPTANATLSYGGTFTVPYVTYDAYGRVTGRTNRTMTMPSAPSVTNISGTAAKATATPNVTFAINSGVAGKTWTVPSGGTWRCQYTVATSQGGGDGYTYSKTIADKSGGTSISNVTDAHAIRIS